MHKIALQGLRKNASKRPLGYYESIVARGRVEGDVLFLEDDVYAELKKKYATKRKLPSVGAQAVSIFGAAGKALLNPKPVSSEERERRLAICNACEFLIDGKRCQKCGCHVNWKSRLEAWHCPVGKW
jgi:hypothetical protein